MNIVILSRNPSLYSTQRLWKAGEKRGHRMYIIDHLNCDIVIERNKPQIFYGRKKLKNIHAIIPRIGASVTFYGTSVVKQFEMMGVFSATGSDALVTARNKLHSLQLLSMAGVGIPKTIFTNYTNDVKKLISFVGGAPLVIKLLEGTQGMGVMLAETDSAAISVIEAFHQLKARVIVQEFIKESDGADIRAFVVDGKVVGSMMRKAKQGDFRSNLHRGGTSVPIELTAEEEQTAINAAKILNLGIAGVDILQSKRGPLVIEVNPSPGLEGIERSTKQDIAGSIIKFIEKNAQA